MPGRRIVVTGEVQGVGFRAYVKDVAQQLDINGEVWNTRWGAVEMVVEHDSEDVLHDFESRLWRGPGLVDSLSSEPSTLDFETGFTIGPSR